VPGAAPRSEAEGREPEPGVTPERAPEAGPVDAGEPAGTTGRGP
jgi:hypothetical protein